MNKVMDKACEMFHEVLMELTDKGHFEKERDVELAKAAVSGIVKIKTLEAMERYEGGSFRGGRSYDDYSRDGESYRRGRGMDGRYVSRDGYSRGGMREKLEDMMQEANGHEKEVIREMLTKM